MFWTCQRGGGEGRGLYLQVLCKVQRHVGHGHLIWLPGQRYIERRLVRGLVVTRERSPGERGLEVRDGHPPANTVTVDKTRGLTLNHKKRTRR